MNTVGKVQIVNGSDVWHADPPITYIPIIDQILSTTIYTFKILTIVQIQPNTKIWRYVYNANISICIWS